MSLDVRLRAALKDRGRKSVELARATGVAPSTVGDWLSGKAKTMVVENAVKVCDYLEVTQDWLFFGKGTMDDARSLSHKRKQAQQILAELPEYAMGEAFKRLSELQSFLEVVKKNSDPDNQ